MLADADSPVESDEKDSSSGDLSEDDTKKFDLLSDGSAAELVAELLRLGDVWPKQTDPVAYLTVSKQKEIAERLMEMEISKKRMKFATISYLESLSLMDSINTRSELGIEEARVNLTEETKRFLKNPDDDIRGLVYLVLTVSPGCDYLASRSAGDLKKFDDAIDAYFDQLSVSIKSCEKLAQLVTRVLISEVHEAETKRIATKTLNRLKTLASTSKRELTLTSFEIQVHFAQLDLPTLVDRMSGVPAESAEEIRRFQKALQAYPNAGVTIYQFALDVIREQIRNEEFVKAREFYDLIKSISPSIENEQTREKLLDALSQFEPFL